ASTKCGTQSAVIFWDLLVWPCARTRSRLVADLYAAKNCGAAQNKGLSGLARISRRTQPCRIVVPAKNSLPMRRHEPSIRHANLHAAEDRVNLQHRFVAFHLRLPQINFNAAKNRHHPSAAEIFSGNPLFDTAENCDFV